MNLTPERQKEFDALGLPVEVLPNVATDDQERFYIKAVNEYHANQQIIADLTAKCERLRDALKRLLESIRRGSSEGGKIC